MARELNAELMRKLDCRYCAHWHGSIEYKYESFYICNWDKCEALECGYDATKLYPDDETFAHGDSNPYSIGTRQYEYGKRVNKLLEGSC